MSELYRYIQKGEPITPKVCIPMAINDMPGGGLRCVKQAKYKLVKVIGNYLFDNGLYRLDGRSVRHIPTVCVIENGVQYGL